MQSIPRRRPGQQANASKAEGRSGYDLAEDRQIRARARFEGISLGRAATKYCGIRIELLHCRSYIASDEHPRLVDAEAMGSEELLLIIRLGDFAAGRSTALRELNPELHEKILRVSTAIAKEQLGKMRRARHTPYMVAHAEYLASLPRYRSIGQAEISESIRY